MSEQSETGIQGTTETDSIETTGTEIQDSVNADTEETFFDPSSIQGKPELEAGYKQMQRTFTKRMQELSKRSGELEASEQKLQAYAAFERDPQGTIKALAQQYGVNLGGEQEQQAFEPQSWDDVLSHLKNAARQELMQEFQPVIKEVQGLKKQNIESYMDNKYSDWRSYESEMMDLISQHPTLASNPDLIYKLAVPNEVLNKRATQAALKKLQGDTESARVTGQTTTGRKSNAPRKASSFNEAVQMAKESLASQGIK